MGTTPFPNMTCMPKKYNEKYKSGGGGGMVVISIQEILEFSKLKLKFATTI